MTTQIIDPFEDPDFADANDPAAMAQTEALLSSLESTAAPVPTITDQPETFFRLPGSQEHVEVRELTGRDEEAVDRARKTGEPLRIVQTLVEAGTVRIGSSEPNSSVLDDMLVGDREYLLTVIREATYGPEIDLGDPICPRCKTRVHLTVDVKDIPVRRLDSKSEASFEVSLRKGGRAEVHLPTVADQRAALSDTNLTSAERNSIILMRCIDAIYFPDGRQVMVAGFPSVVQNDLSVADRRAILQEIDRRMPGPQYNEVTVDHECGYGIPARIELVSLFPGM